MQSNNHYVPLYLIYVLLVWFFIHCQAYST